MSADELRLLAITALTSLLSTKKVSFPVSTTSLLARVVATRPPAGLFLNPSSPNIRFKLTDKSRFESILESLSHTWEHGSISFSREYGEMTVLSIVLQPSGRALPGVESVLGDGSSSRKRKRVVDEDADSAAGEEDEDSYEDIPPPQPTTLESLNKEMRQVYAILQKSTAKRRLLAEQVRIPFLSLWSVAFNGLTFNRDASSDPSKRRSSPFALM